MNCSFSYTLIYLSTAVERIVCTSDTYLCLVSTTARKLLRLELFYKGDAMYTKCVPKGWMCML